MSSIGNRIVKQNGKSLPYKYYPIGLRSIKWRKLKSINAVRFTFEYWADARAQPYVTDSLHNFSDKFTLDIYSDNEPSDTRKRFMKIINYFGFCYDIITAEELEHINIIDVNKFTTIVKQRLIERFVKNDTNYAYDYLSDILTRL